MLPARRLRVAALIREVNRPVLIAAASLPTLRRAQGVPGKCQFRDSRRRKGAVPAAKQLAVDYGLGEERLRFQFLASKPIW
jgi:hypothetical protein